MRSSSLHVAMIVVLLTGFSCSAQAALIAPDGLNPGDKYHLVFATSTARDATSSNIADYNSFVTAAATAAGSWVKDLSTTWVAIASTQTTDAINNAPITAPVFRVDGVKVADDSTDFWDGNLDSAINLTEVGGSPTAWVWTGSNTSGTEFIQVGGPDDGDSLALGSTDNTSSTVGNPNSASSSWTVGTAAAQTTEFSFYAISGELTVVPEPATLVLLCLGGLGLAGRNCRRKV